MPMRTECKNYESRTYGSGDTVRKCNLGLAPEAPWRCPENCPSYERRLADVAWQRGSLVSPATPDEPDAEGLAELFAETRRVLDAAGPAAIADFESGQRRSRSWRRFLPFSRKR